jgi:aspartokinase
MQTSGIISKASLVLSNNNINIEAISMSFKQVNIQFIINRGHYKESIILLHKEFFN